MSQMGHTNVMKILTITNKMAAGTETEVSVATVIILKMTVKAIWDDGSACCKRKKNA